MNLSNWMRARARTLGMIAVGSTAWLVAFPLAWQFWPAAASLQPDRRVFVALELAAAPALIIFLMTCACLRIFDTPSTEAPLRGSESQRLKINQRVLTNTIEQAWVFVPLLLALAVRLPPGRLKLLPVATAFWCAGRLMFWAGYHVAPHWRAPGFDWTFLTSLTLVLAFLATLV